MGKSRFTGRLLHLNDSLRSSYSIFHNKSTSYRRKTFHLSDNFCFGFTQNKVNAESTSSVQQGSGTRKSRVNHSPASQPWVQSQVTGGSLQRDGPGGFVLDLHKIPDLSKADINQQNPNIQVITHFSKFYIISHVLHLPLVIM